MPVRLEPQAGGFEDVTLLRMAEHPNLMPPRAQLGRDAQRGRDVAATVPGGEQDGAHDVAPSTMAVAGADVPRSA
jgi:hypothetical protein